jgi:hypothetical protein
VLVVQFNDLLESLAATPLILTHRPSAVEVMDRFILNHTRQSAALGALRQSFVDGDPASLLCIELYDDRDQNLLPRLDALERDLREHGFGYRYHCALDLPSQARVWSLREAALGLSMAMKSDAKSLSFVRGHGGPAREAAGLHRAIPRNHRASRNVGRRVRPRIRGMPARPSGREPEDRRRRSNV